MIVVDVLSFRRPDLAATTPSRVPDLNHFLFNGITRPWKWPSSCSWRGPSNLMALYPILISRSLHPRPTRRAFLRELRFRASVIIIIVVVVSDPKYQVETDDPAPTCSDHGSSGNISHRVSRMDTRVHVLDRDSLGRNPGASSSQESRPTDSLTLAMMLHITARTPPPRSPHSHPICDRTLSNPSSP